MEDYEEIKMLVVHALYQFGRSFTDCTFQAITLADPPAASLPREAGPGYSHACLSLFQASVL